VIYFIALSLALNLSYSDKQTARSDAVMSRYVVNGIVTPAFHIPKGLERAVDFWIDVYSKYDIDQMIVHDSDNYVIYEVIDVSDINDLPYFTQEIKDEIVDSRVIRVQKKYRDALKTLHNNKQNIQDMDQFMINLNNKFANIKDDNKFVEASKTGRMRVQKGQRSPFKKGLYYSGKYIPAMEKIFKSYKLPAELARLPFVESYFNPYAVSYKQASGIWQFMKSTGGEYLRVKGDYDERKDPIVSTHAAAKLLKQSYVYLGKNWPLAVTAYNHGRFGIKRATQRSGTNDLVRLIREYKGQNFGFATKNFYAEFLAALYLEKNHKAFFDDVSFARTSNYGVVVTVKPMKVSQLELLLDVDKDDIRMYNPAISNKVFKEDGIISEGARVMVPISRFKRLLSRTETAKDIKDYLRFI
jgi:membrane-bound lytic murein transglycosylase D